VNVVNPLGKEAVIAVVGSGALGQFYAAQFSLAGHSLRLLARRDASVLKERGLVVHQTATPKIRSSLSHPVLRIAPECLTIGTDARLLATPPEPDWVLVALKTTALDQAQQLVDPLLGPATRIVVMCNGLGVEDRFAAWFGAERVYGLLCFVGVNRGEDGTIQHLAFGHVAAGHFLDNPMLRESLVQLCKGAGIACDSTQSLLEARWRKLSWNLPFNGLSLAYNCTTDAIVLDPIRRAFALQLAQEAVAIGNLDLAAHGQDVRIEPEWANLQLLRTDTMGAYAPSTLLDARAGRSQETDVMFAEPARRAQRLGMKAPALRQLLDVLASRGIPV